MPLAKSKCAARLSRKAPLPWSTRNTAGAFCPSKREITMQHLRKGRLIVSLADGSPAESRPFPSGITPAGSAPETLENTALATSLNGWTLSTGLTDAFDFVRSLVSHTILARPSCSRGWRLLWVVATGCGTSEKAGSQYPNFVRHEYGVPNGYPSSIHKETAAGISPIHGCATALFFRRPVELIRR